jgi:hypothetical protein
MNIIVIFGTNEKNSNLNFDTNHISFFHSVQGEPAICSVLINNLWQKSAYPCVLGCQPASKCLLWFTRASSFQMSLMIYKSIQLPNVAYAYEEVYEHPSSFQMSVLCSYMSIMSITP